MTSAETRPDPAGTVRPDPVGTVRPGIDPIMIGVLLLVALVAAWFVTRKPPIGVAVPMMNLVAWVTQIMSVWFAHQIVGHLDRDDPGRRFWACFRFGLAACVVLFCANLYWAFTDPAGSLVGAGVSAAGNGIAMAAVAFGILTFPVGVTGRRQRAMFWLDVTTVMVGVVTIGLYAMNPVAIVRDVESSHVWGVLLTQGLAAVALSGAVKLLIIGRAPFGRVAGWIGVAAVTVGGSGILLSARFVATGREHWLMLLAVVGGGCVMAMAGMELHHRQGGLPSRERPRKRPYSALPYLSIASTFVVLVVILAQQGLYGRTWILVCGAIGSTALVVVRQLTAFADNARLLRELEEALAERDALAEQFRQLAFRDSLTGLGNRAYFIDHLAAEMTTARRERQPVAVMIIDLDHFKPINDRFGHAAGDRVLREVGVRLRACLRGSATIARLGGDEFAAVLRDPDRTAVNDLAQRVIRTVQEPYHLGSVGAGAGAEVQIAASIGVAIDPTAASTPDQILSYADDAMYVIKTGSRNGVRIVTVNPRPSAATSY